ncbi:MAG: hypothetical protein RLZ72_666 [Actinomycetota bacterium]|jgi:subtilisin family serine protease
MFGRRARLILATVLVALLGFSTPANADTYRSSEWWIGGLGVTKAWKTATGKGITIAIIDGGVDGSHPDLTGQVIGGTDMSGVGSSDGETPVPPNKRHGTQVASLVAGHGDNGNGVMGTAPDAKLLSISVSFSSGTTSGDEQVAKALTWAVNHGADIVVMSFVMGRSWWTPAWDEAFLKAEKAGVLIVAAAGNRGSGTLSIGAPASIPGVLAVGGISRSRVVSSFASTKGSTIGVVAPSEKLPGSIPGGGRVKWNGTSGAAPIVAGIAALVMEAHPELDTINVINRILVSADPVGKVGNVNYGWGVIDADEAVNGDIPTVTVNPLGTLAAWIPLHRYEEWASTVVELPLPGELPLPDDRSVSVGLWWADLGVPGIVLGGIALSVAILVYGIVRRLPRKAKVESDSALPVDRVDL